MSCGSHYRSQVWRIEEGRWLAAIYLTRWPGMEKEPMSQRMMKLSERILKSHADSEGAAYKWARNRIRELHRKYHSTGPRSEG